MRRPRSLGRNTGAAHSRNPADSRLDPSRRRTLARLIATERVGAPLTGELRELARTEGVLPLVDWISEGLGGLRAQAAAQLARQARLTRVLNLLADEGVTAIVFKGAHLAHTCYPDPALRPHVDTDLLIRVEHAAATRRVLERSGHTLLPHVSGQFVMSQCHYVDGATGGAHAYDIHWQIANGIAFRDCLTFDEVRARAVPLEAFGPHGWGPSLPHALLLACIHRAAHHSGSERLIWLADVRLLLRTATAADVAEFCRLADAKGVNALCFDGCARAAELFGDVSIPSSLASRAAVSLEPTRAYLQTLPRRTALWLDLRALTTWRDRLLLLREHLFPPTAYIKQISGSRVPVAWGYTARIIRGLAGWAGRS